MATSSDGAARRAIVRGLLAARGGATFLVNITSEREFDALLADNPGFGAAWAVLAFQAARRGDPDNVEARFMLARRAVASGDYDRAKMWLAEIWELDARDPSSRRGAGELQR